VKIFLDANVLFSGGHISSNLRKLIEYLSEFHDLVTSDYAYTEARRNILSKRPLWLEGFQRMMSAIQVVSSIDADVEVQIAAKDRPILATAIRESCNILMTGDKRDFGFFYGQTIQGVTVMSPLIVAKKLVQKKLEG